MHLWQGTPPEHLTLLCLQARQLTLFGAWETWLALKNLALEEEEELGPPGWERGGDWDRECSASRSCELEGVARALISLP